MPMKLFKRVSPFVCSVLLGPGACQSSPDPVGASNPGQQTPADPAQSGSAQTEPDPAQGQPPIDCFFGDVDGSCSWLTWLDGTGPAPAHIEATGIHRWTASALQVSGDCTPWAWPLALNASLDQPMDWQLPEAAAVYSAAVRTTDAAQTLAVADIMQSWPVAADAARLAIVDRLPAGTPVDVLIPDEATLARLRQHIRARLVAADDPALHAAGLARLVWPWSTARGGGAASESLLRELTHELLRAHVQRGGFDAHRMVLHVHSWSAWLAVRTAQDARVMLLRSLEQALSADLAATPIWSVPLELQLLHSIAGMVPAPGSPARSVGTASDTLLVIGSTLARVEAPANADDPSLNRRWQLSPVLPPLLLIAIPGTDEEVASTLWTGAMEQLTSREVPPSTRVWLSNQWSGLVDARRETRVFQPSAPGADVLAAYPELANALFEWFMVIGHSMSPTSWCTWSGPPTPEARWMAMAVDGWIDCGEGAGLRETLMGASRAALQQSWDEELARRCGDGVPGMPEEFQGSTPNALAMLGSPRTLRAAVVAEHVGGWFMGGAQTAWLAGVGLPLGAPLGNRTVGPSIRLPAADQWRMSMSRDALTVMNAMLHLSPLTTGPGFADALLANRTSVVLPGPEQARQLQLEGLVFTAVDLQNARLAMMGVRERSDGDVESTLTFNGQVSEARRLSGPEFSTSAGNPLLRSMVRQLVAWAADVGDPGMSGSQALELFERLSAEGLFHEADGVLRFYCQALSEQEVPAAVGHCAYLVEQAISIRLPSTPAGIDAVELAVRNALVQGKAEWAAAGLAATLSEAQASLSDGRYTELMLLLLQAQIEAGVWPAAAQTAYRIQTIFRWQGPGRATLVAVFAAMEQGCVWLARGVVDVPSTALLAATASTALESDLALSIRRAWEADLAATERDARVEAWLRSMFDTEGQPFWRQQTAAVPE
jgi:hypothetical protein